MNTNFDDIQLFMEKIIYSAGKKAFNKIHDIKKIYTKNQYDVQINLDILIEEFIVQSIKKEFPNHAIFSEESKLITSKNKLDNLWIIDPIEGSNNIAYNIPYFGISITYLEVMKPIVATIYNPIMNDLYTVQKNFGAKLNNHPIITNGHIKNIENTNIAIVVNYTREGKDKKISLYQELEKNCKRVLDLWAPAIDLARISSNMLDGMICYKTPFVDICSGLLLISESNGILINLDGERLDIFNFALDDTISFIAAGTEELAKDLLDIYNLSSN
jgi:myo-inositol-1(or 4)-monophosphatase